MVGAYSSVVTSLSSVSRRDLGRYGTDLGLLAKDQFQIGRLLGYKGITRVHKVPGMFCNPCVDVDTAHKVFSKLISNLLHHPHYCVLH